jgi:hypothetical protein
MAHHADRIVNSRRDRSEFRSLVSLLIHHAAPADTEPTAARGFVCHTCRHVFELCTCNRDNSQEVTL